MTPLSPHSPGIILSPPWTLLSWRISLPLPSCLLAHLDQLSDCMGGPSLETYSGPPTLKTSLRALPPPPPSSGTGEGMALDFPPGIGDQSAYAISLTVTEDGLENDLSAAVQFLEYINTWLT